MGMDVRTRIPGVVLDESGADLARSFSALGNPVRLALVRMLAKTSGCFCGDIVERFGLAQSTVSHHLKVLKEAELIRGYERGTYVCYCADRERLAALGDWLRRFSDCASAECTSILDLSGGDQRRPA